MNLLADVLLTHRHARGPKQPEPEKNRNRGQVRRSLEGFQNIRRLLLLFPALTFSIHLRRLALASSEIVLC